MPDRISRPPWLLPSVRSSQLYRWSTSFFANEEAESQGCEATSPKPPHSLVAESTLKSRSVQFRSQPLAFPDKLLWLGLRAKMAAGVLLHNSPGRQVPGGATVEVDSCACRLDLCTNVLSSHSLVLLLLHSTKIHHGPHPSSQCRDWCKNCQVIWRPQEREAGKGAKGKRKWLNEHSVRSTQGPWGPTVTVFSGLGEQCGQ